MTAILTDADVEPVDGSVLQSVGWQGWIWAWVRADEAATSEGEARWFSVIGMTGKGWRLQTRKPIPWDWFGPKDRLTEGLGALHDLVMREVGR